MRNKFLGVSFLISTVLAMGWLWAVIAIVLNDPNLLKLVLSYSSEGWIAAAGVWMVVFIAGLFQEIKKMQNQETND